MALSLQKMTDEVVLYRPVELPTPRLRQRNGRARRGMDNSSVQSGVFKYKKRKPANRLIYLSGVGKILPLPARIVSVPAKKSLETCR